MVWTQYSNSSEAVAKADTLDYTLGVVRSNKEKPAYGIRALAKDFDALWQCLRPSDPKPSQVQGEALYKISPVPTGATNEDVQKWLGLEKLPLRPLRALNTSTWLLVGKADVSPATFTWKQNAILLHRVESNYAKSKSAILAGGKRPVESTRRVWRPESTSNSEVDPLTIFDPWAQPAASRRHSEWSHSSATHASSSSSSSRATSSCAPTDVQITQQKEIDSMKSKIDTLESAMQSQRKDSANFRNEVHVELQQVRKEVSDRVSEVQNTFQHTLTQALSQTQAALRESFHEDFNQLKLLLGAGQGTRKRSERDDQRMDED